MKTKKWIIMAICFILAGCIIFVGIMSILDWDFNSLDTTEYKVRVHRIEENFKNISIDANESDIIFVKENKDCLVTIKQQSKVEYTVAVQNETLKIAINDTRKWYERISVFSFKTPQITVSLPQDKYDSLLINSSTGDIQIPKDFAFEKVDIKASTGDVDCKAASVIDLKIKLSTGNINIENTIVGENVIAGNMNLTTSTGSINVKSVDCSGKFEANVSTGTINLTNIKCEDLISNGNTGDMTLTSVVATNNFNITRSTGDIKFDGCDADELYIKTSTGDVSGNLLTDKVFVCETDTGNVSVPKTTEGGKCEITTDTGNIKIEIGK